MSHSLCQHRFCNYDSQPKYITKLEKTARQGKAYFNRFLEATILQHVFPLNTPCSVPWDKEVFGVIEAARLDWLSSFPTKDVVSRFDCCERFWSSNTCESPDASEDCSSETLKLISGGNLSITELIDAIRIALAKGFSVKLNNSSYCDTGAVNILSICFIQTFFSALCFAYKEWETQLCNE